MVYGSILGTKLKSSFPGEIRKSGMNYDTTGATSKRLSTMDMGRLVSHSLLNESLSNCTISDNLVVTDRKSYLY